MRRKTYEFAERKGGAGGNEEGVRTYIFSRTMVASPEDAELVRDDAVGFVRALKEKPGGNIIVMGSGGLGSALIERGVVDEIAVNIHLLLLGAGAPTFATLAARVELEPVECRPISTGCAFLLYRLSG